MSRKLDKPRKKNPKSNKISKIALANRGNRSVAEVSRSQWEIDNRFGYTGKIINRASWARNPLVDPARHVAK